MEMRDGYTHKHNDFFVVTKRAYHKVILLQSSIHMRKNAYKQIPLRIQALTLYIYECDKSRQTLPGSRSSDKICL